MDGRFTASNSAAKLVHSCCSNFLNQWIPKTCLALLEFLNADLLIKSTVHAMVGLHQLQCMHTA